ncbi:MAG: amidohydrolase family protein [Alphaproteobacteria bacterium]|nr:amidohydrolase family protein [Alphaproteobacteria bacterium]
MTRWRGAGRIPWLLGVLAGCAAHATGEAPVTWADAEAASRAPIEAAPLDAPGRDAWDLVGGTVLTASGSRFAPGRVVITDGRIAWVGPAGEGPTCDACTRVDTTDRVVTPGIIDVHSHLGVYPSPRFDAHDDGNEATAPTTPGVWAESGLWPQDPGFQRAVAGGITTLQILPGSANLIGGRGVVVRPLPARGARAMRFPGAPETVKMACGENPKRVYGDRGGPSTRMGNVRGYRQAFARAEVYDDAWRDHPDDPPPRDPDLDTLAGILRGDFLLQVHCYRADDMLAFLQVAQEFGVHVRAFHHALEAYKIRDVLAEHDVAVATWSDWWGFKAEAYDGVLSNAAMVATAGGRAVIHSDSEIGIQRLNQEAAKAWYDGVDAGFAVSEDEALRWITANAAWVLGIDDQTGTLDVGKRADVVIWDADPLSIRAKALQVRIDGRLVFDVDQPTVWSDFERGQEVSP